MASTIGLRVYKFSVVEEDTKLPLKLNDGRLRGDILQIIDEFIKEYSTVSRDGEKERSWFFESRKTNSETQNHGYIHYGTYGFESHFFDEQTQELSFHRKTTDTERIPLYYNFFVPIEEKFGFISFQSFQGRSCVSIVFAQLVAYFKKNLPRLCVMIEKIMPNAQDNNILSAAPIKSLRFIKQKQSADIADLYQSSGDMDEVKMELSITAKRNRSLGELGNLLKSLKGRTIITYDGISFPEAKADVKIGNKIRKVGLIGVSNDAGIIDVTSTVKFGKNGHPIFQSIATETENIIDEFYQTLRSIKT